MNQAYEDIKKRIKEEPKWFDMNGVPRYDKFHPELCPSIYADEACLMEISCQSCGKKFLVEMHSDDFVEYDISKLIKSNYIHYGDPPNDCCSVGATMNCDNIRIIEFWERNQKTKLKWKRNSKYEIKL